LVTLANFVAARADRVVAAGEDVERFVGGYADERRVERERCAGLPQDEPSLVRGHVDDVAQARPSVGQPFRGLTIRVVPIWETAVQPT
jgi:hypothetical protein